MGKTYSFNVLKWGLYLAATIMITINVLQLHQNWGDSVEMVNSLIFIAFGVAMILMERQQVKQNRKAKKFKQIEEQFDPEMQRAIRFVIINTGTIEPVPEKWVQVAAELFDMDPREIQRAMDEMEADVEYLARTGDLPSQL